ncbi:MAG: beta-ketoacyl-[acyl-carrier-protein] synthase family protein [Nitrospiraceae bacterium]|nr:MAG: beta-ketoacyl-[acyl-carrier-protein] synthase family protein [Nitrospiraceae bacterium]
MMTERRVVVTGLGIVSSVGIGKDNFWKAVINGTSGITKVTSFDTRELRCHYAGEINNFAPEEFIPKRKSLFLGRTSQLAIAATSLALTDADLSRKKLQKQKIGVFIGTTMGERPLEETVDIWVKQGLDNISKSKILQSPANNIPANVAIHFKLEGPNYLIPTACAAGNYAIGYGFDFIKRGDLEYAVVGGADAFSSLAFVGFHRIYAMASEKCQPFDKNRKGMLVGEGAAVLFLESLESATRRNADIYAEIPGYGISCDAFHMTASKAEGIEKAMMNALKYTRTDKDEVDYINAHGTGTQGNDKTECAAIKRVFRRRYKSIPVSSIKSMLGHPMGAASAIEALTCCLTVKENTIPPTINFETPDPQCDIDCVPNTAKVKKVNIALNNGFAFGGNNSCLVVKKFT